MVYHPLYRDKLTIQKKRFLGLGDFRGFSPLNPPLLSVALGGTPLGSSLATPQGISSSCYSLPLGVLLQLYTLRLRTYWGHTAKRVKYDPEAVVRRVLDSSILCAVVEAVSTSGRSLLNNSVLSLEILQVTSKTPH